VVIFGSSRVRSGIAIKQDDSPNRKDKINITSPTLEGGEARTFLPAHLEPGVFDPDAADILVAAFDAAWQSIKASGAHLSDKQIKLTRPILATYTIEQARRGERDQCRLRDGALLHLAQSNLRYPPRDQK
jgi:hypothetical protein